MSRLSKLGFIDTERTRLPVRRRIRSRGVPTALVGREVFCTDDVDETARLVGQMLGPTTLSVDPAHADDFQATMNAIRVHDVTMAYLDLHSAATLDFAATGDHYSVHMPMNATATCTYNGEQLTSTTYQALVVNPATRLLMQMEFDSPQLIIRIERPAIDRQLARMLGRPVDRPVVFHPSMDLTTRPAVRWHGAIQLLSSEVMTDSSLIQQGIGGGPIEELVISSLLWVHESNVFAELTQSAKPSSRSAVKHSISFIEENLAVPITVNDIAQHTRMSVRSIQQGFRDDLGTTPMSYLRDRRLERARAQLAASLPGEGVTVTQVAERWGFGHLGNFSVLYRRRFGESPSATLRR